MLSFLRKKTSELSLNDAALDYSKLPVLNAEQLIQMTGQQNRIRLIKRIVKIDDERFEILYLKVIYRFAELVQLMPASQAHHHAVPGGLFIHTLEVLEHALSIRQQYKLPAFAEQEVQERERHAWTYAVFVAAILHDIGKRITMCSFICDRKPYSAFEATPLSASKHKHYQLVFHETKYHPLHEQLGMALVDIIPSIGRVFLFGHLNIIKEMMAYVHGDKMNAGMIGEIITKADQKSTGSSLAHSPTRKFRGASMENIGERLMTQLRLMIASNDFIINRPNANIYTTANGFTYCVSKVIVDEIRAELHNNNETDIPTDNNRIFDILQEYGFVETNHRTGKSIHYVSIYHRGNQRIFTVLKFQTSKLFQVQPMPFEGQIEETHGRGTAPVTEATQSVTETIPSSVTAVEPHGKAEAENSPSITATEDSDPFPDSDFEAPRSKEVAQIDEDVFDNLMPKSNEKQVAPPAQIVHKAVTTNNKVETVAVSKANSKPVEKLADDFLEWCREKLREKYIVINETNGQIQKVKYEGRDVLALVTPRIFSEFAESIGLPNPKEKSTFTKIQSSIHKSKLNIPAPRGQIHVFKIKKSINNPLNSNVKLRHYLFEIDVICGEDEELKQIISSIEVNGNLIKV